MKNIWLGSAVLLFILACALRIAWATTLPAPPLVWKMESCGTLDCVTAQLNRLPPDRALEAKVVVINSTRSFMGALSNPYYIYYREAQP
jgi:hypothetical protein